ncbi:Vibriobactin utilization protein ViuB [Corynebacterium provencense]|uniref:Vibriobactin utilization protein ViuB n=1 Tax=Corynebacterium provencense TaxID=1737425 RepID=A0A2Z3YMC6_9CORY|nr:siderophore-interacting protein [Corynebacterium provencense]AWT25222.1 Vibriobactin utilization protein ViuB [Corynebacterium provencense]
METIKSLIRSATVRRPVISPQLTVRVVEDLSPGYVRVTLAEEGPSDGGLAAYTEQLPADAMKLLLPDMTVLRAVTVRRYRPGPGEIDVDIARHDHGVLAEWLSGLRPGERVGATGMRCEWALPAGAGEVDRVVLLADPAGIPAAAAVVESLPAGMPADVVVSVNHPEDATLLPRRDGVDLLVVDDLAEVTAGTLPHLSGHLPGSGAGRVQGWIAAETTTVRHLRGVLRDGWSVARDDLLARAYWTRDVDSTRKDEEEMVKFREAMAAGEDVSDPGLAERISLGDRD